MAHSLALLLVEPKNCRKAPKENPVLKRLLKATSIAVNFLATTLEGNRAENPSPRKIGIAMAGGLPITFHLTVHSLEHPKEVVTFIPTFWSRHETNQKIMFIAGHTSDYSKQIYKIQYYPETGLAYHDAGSMSEVAA